MSRIEAEYKASVFQIIENWSGHTALTLSEKVLTIAQKCVDDGMAKNLDCGAVATKIMSNSAFDKM